jgi:hypothetical protein
MKTDRFLLGILIAIATVVVIALTLFFTRQDRQEYMAENTPKGVVHNYALAVINGDFSKAYSYLAEAENKPSYETFRQAFSSRYVDPSNAGLEIGDIEISGDDAFVTVYLIYYSNDPFSSSYRSSEEARLERQNGSWKLLQMPYNFWAYDWYKPTPKPVY